VAQVIYHAAREALPPYSHRFSPRTYTQAQLFTCLVLKIFFRTDYRGIVAILADLPELCRVIGLTKIPHFTALQKADQRLLTLKNYRRLAATLLREARHRKMRVRRPALAAMDATGLESRHVSAHYAHKRTRNRQNQRLRRHRPHPKAAVLCDCRSHLILAGWAGRGPGDDLAHFRPLFEQCRGIGLPKTLLQDAGYDAEWVHVYCRKAQVRSIIPPTRGKPSSKPPRGRYRRLMARRFPKKTYGQRAQVETVNSMYKRNQGSALHARKGRNQNREILLRLLTHNVVIIPP
jgi:hypothetical protein